MAMDLAVQTFSTKPDYLIAGTDIRITTAVKEAGCRADPRHGGMPCRRQAEAARRYRQR